MYKDRTALTILWLVAAAGTVHQATQNLAGGEGNTGAGRSMNRTIAKFSMLFAAGALVAAAGPASTEPVTMTVVMIDYKFEPDHLTFQRGTHYRLHLENHGKETHELTAPTFFAAAKIDNPDVLNPERTEVVMQPGESEDLLLTPGKPGTYDLRCADHDWNGMVGGITVQ